MSDLRFDMPLDVLVKVLRDFRREDLARFACLWVFVLVSVASSIAVNTYQNARISNLERERTEARVVEGRDAEEPSNPDRQDD